MIKNTKKPVTVKVGRSAKTGLFVSKKNVATHPSTTVTQTIKRGVKK
jgi:hypothetical protein